MGHRKARLLQGPGERHRQVNRRRHSGATVLQLEPLRQTGDVGPCRHSHLCDIHDLTFTTEEDIWGSASTEPSHSSRSPAKPVFSRGGPADEPVICPCDSTREYVAVASTLGGAKEAVPAPCSP